MSPTLALPVTGSRLLRALAAQAGGVAIATGCSALAAWIAGSPPPGWQWLLIQAVSAGAIAGLLRMEWWWWGFNAAFAPALAAGMAASLPAAASALLLAILLLAYGGTQGTRVPLYLSNAAAVQAFIGLVPEGQRLRVLDLGCGTGTILRALSRQRPLAKAQGVERAPLPWMIAWLRSVLRRDGSDVTWGNLWSIDLSQQDVVYAYLSPAAMPRLWEKARREMRPGTLLVSFRFGIPGAAPDIQAEAGASRLHAWRI